MEHATKMPPLRRSRIKNKGNQLVDLQKSNVYGWIRGEDN